MGMSTLQEVYLLYYMKPNNHVAVVGVYSTDVDARRADSLARKVQPELTQEGVEGPYIRRVPFNDFFFGEDNFTDIEEPPAQK